MSRYLGQDDIGLLLRFFRLAHGNIDVAEFSAQLQVVRRQLTGLGQEPNGTVKAVLLIINRSQPPYGAGIQRIQLQHIQVLHLGLRILARVKVLIRPLHVPGPACLGRTARHQANQQTCGDGREENSG